MGSLFCTLGHCLGTARLQLCLLGLACGLVAREAVECSTTIAHLPVGVKVDGLDAWRRDTRIKLWRLAAVYGEGGGGAIYGVIVVR